MAATLLIASTCFSTSARSRTCGSTVMILTLAGSMPFAFRKGSRNGWSTVPCGLPIDLPTRSCGLRIGESASTPMPMVIR